MAHLCHCAMSREDRFAVQTDLWQTAITVAHFQILHSSAPNLQQQQTCF
jgi:hypothetical protein